MAQWLREALLKEVGLTASCGVASNKVLARMVGPLHKPNGLTVLPSSAVASFLATLPLRTVPSLR